ncbi:MULTISPECIES: hypothetical protein [unclassified Vibrio]|uniref:hypothetical protein n=1 Tax=unclassified Vibrio TaxID=2614977 RepID=UPI0013616825|nr:MULTISPECIES: hypothetical protein [unclassified Vibrio]NAW57306.1 hypothetical protein [Vibrio sp. V36_P2S2PM302]NAX25276.1 hypothetical protein [Vibrio sp. V38_P2S17PM301]NAX29746.1 hypothetical protein [Vibrio sp. V37_P2S8PM304]
MSKVKDLLWNAVGIIGIVILGWGYAHQFKAHLNLLTNGFMSVSTFTVYGYASYIVFFVIIGFLIACLTVFAKAYYDVKLKGRSTEGYLPKALTLGLSILVVFIIMGGALRYFIANTYQNLGYDICPKNRAVERYSKDVYVNSLSLCE